MSVSGQPEEQALDLQEHRFSRFEAIKWWDQSLLGNAKILIIGAGALGNEVIKNCALLGIGNCIIVDNDRIELSNLSRSVLFRAPDEKRFKAECAAEAALSIYPDARYVPMVGNVLADVGIGYFHWADIVISAVDNREARVFINRICCRLGKPWIDGGLDVLNGIIRGFDPPATACYECTMGKADWDLIDKRNSCSLIARQAFAAGGLATTPTIASIIGALEVQEALKFLHDKEWLSGKGYFFEGTSHSSYTINYPIKPDCPNHEPSEPIVVPGGLSQASPLRQVWEIAGEILGGCDALDLNREMVSTLTCPSCGSKRDVLRPTESLPASVLLCPGCRCECIPDFFHSISMGSPYMDRSLAAAGLPDRDIIWARYGESSVGISISGDIPIPLGKGRAAN